MASISSAPHHRVDHGPLLPGLPGFCFVIDVTFLAHSHLLLLAPVCRLDRHLDERHDCIIAMAFWLDGRGVGGVEDPGRGAGALNNRDWD
jgi:hypothetical protein